MPSPGADRSGQVRGSRAAPREEFEETVPSRVRRPPSAYEAMLRTPARVVADGSGLVWLTLPSPVELPAAQTVVTPASTRACSRPARTAPLAPQDIDITRIGGQTEAGTMVPH